MPDPLAQMDEQVAGEYSNVPVDQLPSHQTVPLGPASVDVTNKSHQETETP